MKSIGFFESKTDLIANSEIYLQLEGTSILSLNKIDHGTARLGVYFFYYLSIQNHPNNIISIPQLHNLIPLKQTQNHLHTTEDFPQMIRIIFWNSFGFMFYGFMIPYVTSEQFGVDATIIGILIAAQPFGRLLITPLVGYLTDKISKKLLVMIGSFGRTVSYTIFYFSIINNSIVGFGVGIFVQGVLVAFFWPPFNSLVAEKSSKYFRSEAYGKRHGMIGYGSLVGAIISFSLFALGLYVFNENPWIQFSPLIIFASVNVFAGLRFLKKVDENIKFQEIEHDPDLPKTKKNTSTTSNKMKWSVIFGFIFLSITILFSSMNEHTTQPFIQVFMYDNLELTTLTIMIILYGSRIISLIVAPKLGVIADKVGVIGFVIVSIVGSIVTAIIISTTIPWLFIILLLIDLTLATAGQLIAQNLFSRISLTHRGRIFGLVEIMNQTGWVIGPILGGWLWELIHPKAPFILSIILELSLIPFFLLALRRLIKQMDEKIE
ncbi:MAG: MFS transporter [Promethearchaeota archaeon]